MFDLRPVGYLLGLFVAALGAAMLIPAVLGLVNADGSAEAFFVSAFFAAAIGCITALGAGGVGDKRLNIQQIFLMTTLVWLVLPIFGALPFYIGAPQAQFVDAFFEAMSGLTTTGSTVFSELEDMPRATLLWRAMLQWFGGVGIVVVAMALLPALRVGGMQIFRSESFDTMGKVLPRAAEISVSISSIYLGLTGACIIGYSFAGMSFFDAITHALTTVATGGFANYDASFGAMEGAPEYVSIVFMILASLPFVRYVQLVGGTATPLLHDTQIRTFLGMIVTIVLVMALYRIARNGDVAEPAIRQTLFNVTSIITGTGYASDDYQLWGPFPVTAFFLIGLIGGCAGSTCCSIKVFRYQLLFAAIRAQIRLLHSPNGVFTPRYEGRKVDQEVFSSVMAFFVMFMASLITVSVILGLTGLDFVTSISGAAAALANIGPGLGDIIGPSGNFSTLSDTAKWVLAITMLVGRLELMSVFVLFTIAYWRH